MTARSEVVLRPVKKDELDVLKERLARHLPQSYAVSKDAEVLYWVKI